MEKQARQLVLSLMPEPEGQFLLRSSPQVSHLSCSNRNRSVLPEGCLCCTMYAPVPHPLGGKLNSAYTAGKCQALPRLVSMLCPHRLQCLESPKAEALGSDLSTWLCSPSFLFVLVQTLWLTWWIRSPGLRDLPSTRWLL